MDSKTFNNFFEKKTYYEWSVVKVILNKQRHLSLKWLLSTFLVLALVFTSFSPFVSATEKEGSVPEESVLLPYDAEWSYLDQGTDLGTEWLNSDYDYSSWKTGKAPLGYGDAVWKQTLIFH